MKKLTLTSQKHSPTFDAVRMLVFQLPIENRVALYEELQKKDWEKQFDRVFSTLSQAAKASKYSAKDIPNLIEEIRHNQPRKKNKI